MGGILVLHGPNLNLLGEREVDVYGRTDLEAINEALRRRAEARGVRIEILQSNHEGVLIDALHEARTWAKGVIFNPGGYTHTSVALRDAVAAIRIPVVEVHLSNVQAREPFRHRSLIAPVAWGQIAGFGALGYLLAFDALMHRFAEEEATR